ncbi:MAG: hypothetical protein ACRCV0_04500 [Brevinema sp.]
MAKMLEGNKMIGLYNGVSEPYLELVQELYNNGKLKDVTSIYNQKFTYWCIALTEDQYNAIGEKNIENLYSIYKNNASLCQLLLNKIFDDKLCMPSYHQIGQAFDLSPITATVSKASTLYDSNKQMVRDTYIHFTIR